MCEWAWHEHIDNRLYVKSGFPSSGSERIVPEAIFKNLPWPNLILSNLPAAFPTQLRRFDTSGEPAKSTPGIRHAIYLTRDEELRA
jgi:hypothetical protein